MDDLFTPKQVARAIKVSESSVKRWCDRGDIPTQYTAGGHRRIPVAGLIDFLRGSNHELVLPEMLGLPAHTGRSNRSLSQSLELIIDALIAGDEAKCHRVTLDLYLSEHSISSICDEVLAAAFTQIGDRWECGEAEVYQERRGCQMALRVLGELRRLLPPPPAEASVAIGGAIAFDPYSLATAMVELTLRDQKWNAVSLGSNLPLETLAKAIEKHHPRLFWLSCSHIRNEDAFVDEYNEFYDVYGSDTAIVLGGKALHEPLRQRIRYAAYCDNMRHLESFAQSISKNLES